MCAHVQKHVELRGQLSELILAPSLCGIKLRSLCVPQMPSQHLVGPQQQIFKKIIYFSFNRKFCRLS